jgi:hypothetical protein
VSGRAHGNAEGRFTEANLKGLFGDKVVLSAAHLPVPPFRDLRHVDAASFIQRGSPSVGRPAYIPIKLSSNLA